MVSTAGPEHLLQVMVSPFDRQIQIPGEEKNS
jgi:hypothetical protein